MANLQTNPLVWLDMEMTGLDPQTCVPLQVAVILTNENLDEIEATEITIWQPESALEIMSPFVRKMHTDNGLLDQVRTSPVGLSHAEQRLMTLLTNHCQYQQGILCGNSIHQDRRFLNAYFPNLAHYLHYRMIDVSSIKELVRRWYGATHLYGKNEMPAHTALADIRDSISELKYYKEAFFQDLTTQK
ncbi:MAG: oligoribonuclease [Myxococcota bacterium]|nr:oligoribonuclease [Myxococcota bacterium]